MDGRKFVSILVVVVLVLSVYFVAAKKFDWFPYKEEIFPSPPEGCKLDYSFIRNMTENLSYTIKKYPDGMMPKGRAFGTWGEHYAARLIFENMTEMGLYPITETIHRLPNLPEKITSKIDILEKNFTIDGRDVDCFIAPNWTDPINGKNLTRSFSFSATKVKNISVASVFPGFYEALKNITSNFADTDFTFEGLLEKLERYLENTNISSSMWSNQTLAEEKEDFFYIAEDPFFNPKYIPLPLKWNIIKNPFTPANLYWNLLLILIKMDMVWQPFWHAHGDHCKGLILYDFNNKTGTHDMINLQHTVGSSNMTGLTSNSYPIIFINNSDGKKLLSKDCNISYHLKMFYNDSVDSHNVIGQINGTCPDKTIIVDSLYDCWWCQGTGDSAIGMSMVLGIARCLSEYFEENNITPKYNIKFIAFCGEEYGFRGALYHAANLSGEKIEYVIDLNQLGFSQPQESDPELVFNVIANSPGFLGDVRQIVNREHHINGTDIDFWNMWKGAPSNDYAFARKAHTVCFLKDTGWTHHHRDGINHTEGDSMLYYDPDDVKATAKTVLDVVYGLTFKEEKTGSIIPFLITLVIIGVSIAVIMKKKRRI